MHDTTIVIVDTHAHHGTAYGQPACEISRAVGKRLCHHPYQHDASKRRSSSTQRMQGADTAFNEY